MLTALLAGCATTTAPPASTSSLDGRWRARLDSPGGPLPFGLEIAGKKAWLLNGAERAPVSSVEVGDEVVVRIDWYDAELRAKVDGDTLRGAWKKRTSSGWSTLPFVAERGEGPRFEPLEGASGSVDGNWRVEFTDEDETYVARAEFSQKGAVVEGTFLTATGDYRFLEGRFEAGTLRLSCFDGAHAFLFTARLAEDGSLSGDFWSRDVYHATWTAQRAEGDVLPDPNGLASITNEEGRLRFEFPDLNGNPVRLDDERFANKVVIVDIFGTWCPNCNDQAPVLAEWHRRYGPRGFEIVGLAYEVTGDAERDRRQLEVYKKRHGIEFPLLLAGTSNKKKAGETLPDLSAVVAYPTTIFVGRDGRVRRVYTGFSGPGTGEHYKTLVEDHEAEIERLLAEN